MIKDIEIAEEAIRDFCEKNHILKLSLFGSVLREDFGDESDLDVLVEFAADQPIGFFEFCAIQDELGELVGRHVDLNTAGFLSRHFVDKVLESAQVIYERS